MAREQPAGYVCDGCGRLARDPEQDMQKLREDNFLSCCPEREMLPVYTRPAPAATDTGLETVAKLGGINGVMLLRHIENLRPEAQAAYKYELVRRSQADELLAAERAEKEKAQASRLYWKGKHQKLEADNAAKYEHLCHWQHKWAQSENERQALEAKLEAAEKALEFYAEHVSGCRKIGADGDKFRASLDADGGSKARAVLGGKP